MPTENYLFPHPSTSDKQGLLAMGGDLSPERLLQAYSQGIFPWYEPGCPILWWSPHPRLILYPQDLKVSHSLKQSLKKPFHWTLNTAFKEVIRACSFTQERLNNTWISEEMIEAYTTLHTMGYAHSLEVWDNSALIGGLYGVSMGRAFFGESMFHLEKDASKIALYHLCQLLQTYAFNFIDCQMPTPHLMSLGAIMISRNEFLHLLAESINTPPAKPGVFL